MSHLIIEQGNEVGTEVTVPPAGLKFGRSPANDLVLEDDAAMLFHGRLFFKSDGTLWVTDFGAGEKTTVGGIPVDEHALAVGDLVEVGNTAFRIIHTQMAEKDSASPVEAEEVDLGFKSAAKAKRSSPAKERTKSSALMHRVLQVAIVLLIILLLVVVLPEFIKLKTPESTPADVPKNLTFVYEHVQGDWENIFRYQLELTEEGRVSIEVDDLRNRHISKSKLVDSKAIKTLSRRLEGSGFFEVEGHREAAARNRYKLYDIAVCRNGEFSHIRVLNRELPSEMRQTVSILEDFVFGALDIPFTFLEDPTVLINYAEIAFKLGEARLAERDVKQGNLAEAIKYYKEALVYIETLDPKPLFHPQAVEGLAKAVAEQEVRFKDYMFNVNRAIRLGDWSEASKNLRVLAELIPDRKDERHEVIRAKQLEVEDHLR